MKTTRNPRRILSLILALVMVFALASVAFAADEKGSITINNATNGQEYHLYRIFDLISYDTEQNHYSYKLNDAWAGFTAGTFFTTDTNGYVVLAEGADNEESAKALAADALLYAKGNSIASAKTATTANETVKFTDLDLDYYLIDSTVGTLLALQTTNPNVSFNDKNLAPTIEKFVKEGDNWVTESDAFSEDEVLFRAVITTQAGATGYVFNDYFAAPNESIYINEDSIRVTYMTWKSPRSTGYGETILQVDCRIYGIDVPLVQFFSEKLAGLAKPLEMHYLPLPQEFDDVAHVRIIAEP